MLRLRPTTLILIAMLASLTPLLGCTRKAPPRAMMNQPSLVVVFDSIPEEERPEIDRFMRASGATERGAMQYELPLESVRDGRALFTDVGTDVQAWHERIRRITNRSGARIPTHDSAVITLRYISTNALSDSDASITIRAYPPGATLHIETPVPGIADRLNDDGSAKLVDGAFRVALPFSFIRRTDRIYFYTRFRGSKRYFYYDVARQQQIEPPGIVNDVDWGDYKRIRGDG